MGLNIKAAEEHYNARYVGYYDLPDREGPYHVFWTDNPDRDKGHDNYFGLFIHPIKGGVYIMSAATIREAVYPAIALSDGSFLVSRYRHDYRTEDGAMIDGGLAYTRCYPTRPPTHDMRVVDGHEVYTPIPPKEPKDG